MIKETTYQIPIMLYSTNKLLIRYFLIYDFNYFKTFLI